MTDTSTARGGRPTPRRTAAAVLALAAAGLVTLGVWPGDGPADPAGAPSAAAGGTLPSAAASGSATRPRPVSPPTRRADATPRPRRVLTAGPVLPASAPVQLDIPALRTSTPLIELGLQSDGTMQVPGDAETGGWFTGAPTPGALGPAVIAAHVNLDGRPGAFAQLATLRPADTIRVTRADGTIAVFGVTTVQQHRKDRFPTDAVYGAIDHAGLRLITCGGDFDSSRRSYRDNIVVFARLVRAQGR